MKRYIYRLLILLTIIATSSCESYLVNDELDGFWQVLNIEDKQNDNITNCNGDTYYSFQRELVLVSYVLPNRPIGQMKENYIAYFTRENDSIYMTDFRIYLDREGKQAELQGLKKFGLHDTFNTFHIEKLNSEELILNSDKTRIILKKH